MLSFSQFLLLVSIIGLSFYSGCARADESPTRQTVVDVLPTQPPTPSVTPTPATPLTEVKTAGFDIQKVPVVTPQLGKFPYFSLIEGYRPIDEKNVDFDRYEFFDGSKILPVEGRLATIEAEGNSASAFQVFKTYESLVTGLGGVKVFEGVGDDLDQQKVEYKDLRHRYPVYDTDQIGVYMLRTPESEIWVETYINPNRKGHYALTVVEKKALEVKASLLPAEEMKKELDAKGHVALYINFDFDKSDIKPDSQPIIEQIVKLLKTNPDLNLTVEGHTDNVGTPAYNKQLSEARAKAVVTALTVQGIETRRLKAAGFGQDKPIADNNADQGRGLNRRVELVKM